MSILIDEFRNLILYGEMAIMTAGEFESELTALETRLSTAEDEVARLREVVGSQLKEMNRKVKQIEWDGTTPVTEYDGDHMFFSTDEIEEYMDESEITEIQLVVAFQDFPHFDAQDFVWDCLPDDKDFNPIDDEEYDKLDKFVKEWIEANKEHFGWTTKYPMEGFVYKLNEVLK